MAFAPFVVCGVGESGHTPRIARNGHPTINPPYNALIPRFPPVKPLYALSRIHGVDRDSNSFPLQRNIGESSLFYIYIFFKEKTTEICPVFPRSGDIGTDSPRTGG
jgi:hypothetical protein